MQSENKTLIVIPVYKKELEDSEIISLCQALKVLPQSVFCLACPENLIIDSYINYFHETGVHFSIERFNNEYFKSIEGYNQLLLSTEFYQRFQPWEYILIYQLDCYIFKNEIDYWVGQNFDYIGAPWINTDLPIRFYNSLNYSRWPLLSRLKKAIDFNKGAKIYVGNGGLSLRKVKTFIRISKILNLLFKRHLRGHINEDFVWSLLVTKYFKNFNIPSWQVASKFALEQTNEKIDISENDKLPMASHAWKRYYPEVWEALVLKFS